MKKLINQLKFLALVPLMSLVFTAPIALATDAKTAITCGVNSAAGSNSCTAKPTTSLDDTVKTIVNILSAVVGVIAVVMIIIAGLRYASSAGDPEAAKGAKNTILYAVIGLAIAAVAQVIVHFVLHNVG